LVYELFEWKIVGYDFKMRIFAVLYYLSSMALDTPSKVNQLKLIDKIAGKIRKGQTIFELRFSIDDFGMEYNNRSLSAQIFRGEISLSMNNSKDPNTFRNDLINETIRIDEYLPNVVFSYFGNDSAEFGKTLQQSGF